MYNKKILLYLNDIKDSINAINDYISSMTFDEFINDRKTYMAVIREFEIIGEAVKNLPDSIKTKYQNIEWRDIVDFRNLLIHQYFGVDLEIVWKTIHEDLPPLKHAIEDIEKKYIIKRTNAMYSVYATHGVRSIYMIALQLLP